MLWYGYFFFFFVYFIVFGFFLIISKIMVSRNIYKTQLFFFLSIFLIIFFLFFSLISLFFLYINFNFWSNFIFFFNKYNFFFFENIYSFFYYFLNNFSLNYVQIYYFPFIYIFILITILSIIFCLTYSFNEIIIFIFYVSLILFFGYLFFFTDSLILFFLSYEMLLLPSFFILYKFAKTKRSIEAAYLMFFWTQFGALFLLFSFIYLFFLTKTSNFWIINLYIFSKFEINFLFICWIIGFGVKLPIWPFYGWLPKAHVEASTNFSIFLSGVLVKFAFFGLFRCLVLIQIEPVFFFIFPFLTIGIIDSSFKLFYQIDLKKLVAYSTVLEMHWLTFCIISGLTPLILSSFCMLISHALLSTNSFLLVDAINRRFKTRLITEISGINYLCPKLFVVILLNLLIFLGFPGSIFFIAEFLFFSFFFDIFPTLTIFFFIILYLLAPTFFFRSWMNTIFGSIKLFNKKIPLDLNKKEYFIFGNLIFLMFWLGFSWQCFIF